MQLEKGIKSPGYQSWIPFSSSGECEEGADPCKARDHRHGRAYWCGGTEAAAGQAEGQVKPAA